MSGSEAEIYLLNVLDRKVPCDALAALVQALRPESTQVELSKTAIGLDANVFLRLTGHRKGADVIDYLSSRHEAPLILPGQAIQEFWNNQLHVVETVATSLRKKFEALKSDLEKIDLGFENYTNDIRTILDKFNEDHGNIYDDVTVRSILNLLDTIKTRAVVPFASRTLFRDICSIRKRTRTPPGFRDDADGDFFIWIDFLTGLQDARSNGNDFTRAILITLDKKVDWSRSGVAHPILAAEVRVLVDASFEIWSIERLAEEISKVM